MDKIRTSDVSGQMHYLSNWYKQFQIDNDTVTKKSYDEGSSASNTDASPVKRTSSGRIVRQRADLALYKDDNAKENEKQKDSPPQRSETSPTSRPTSLNPFRIPVNLLNFKQTQTSLVARQQK